MTTKYFLEHKKNTDMCIMIIDVEPDIDQIKKLFSSLSFFLITSYKRWHLLE